MEDVERRNPRWLHQPSHHLFRRRLYVGTRKFARALAFVTAVFFIGLGVFFLIFLPVGKGILFLEQFMLEEVLWGASDEATTSPAEVAPWKEAFGINSVKRTEANYSASKTDLLTVDRLIGCTFIVFGIVVLVSMLRGCCGRLAKVPQLIGALIILAGFGYLIYPSFRLFYGFRNLAEVFQKSLNMPVPVSRNLSFSVLCNCSTMKNIDPQDRVVIPAEYLLKEQYFLGVRKLFQDPVNELDPKINSRRLRFCRAETKLKCRGFHDNDCTPDIEFGPCAKDAKRAEKIDRKNMTCLCAPCGESINYTRGCFSSVARSINGFEKLLANRYLHAVMGQSVIATTLAGLAVLTMWCA